MDRNTIFVRMHSHLKFNESKKFSGGKDTHISIMCVEIQCEFVPD